MNDLVNCLCKCKTLIFDDDTLRAVKTGRAVRAGPFNPINFRAWALNIESEF